MNRASENETLAAAITDLFRNEFGIEVVIETCPTGGYQIETDAGASFTFEICAPTKAAVACAYLEHIRSVWRYALNAGNGFWRCLSTRQERQRLQDRLNRLETWARQNLPA